MGYGLVIARDAYFDIQRLDIWLQEEVLDELDELADEPPTAPPEVRNYRMIRLRGDEVYIVFLRLLVDPATAMLTLLGVSSAPGT